MKTQSPTISIIINNYNYGRFLGEAIDSVLAQTYPFVEVIVVDDGSTDDSRQVIESFGERVCPIFKANGGQASALNAGFAISTGGLVLFLDSDDSLAPNAMETAVPEWQDGLARVYFPLQTVDVRGKPLGKVFDVPKGPSALLGPFGGPITMSGTVFSRNVLERIMPIPDEDWKICADYYLCAMSTLFGEVKCLRQPLVKYRLHGGNNYSSGGDVDESRKKIFFDLKLHGALSQFTDGRIRPLEDWLGACPRHWLKRIKLLREKPRDYPWPDTLPALTVRAVKACWHEPDRSFYHRLAYSAFVLAYGLLPRKATLRLRNVIRKVDGQESGKTFRFLLGP